MKRRGNITGALALAVLALVATACPPDTGPTPGPDVAFTDGNIVLTAPLTVTHGIDGWKFSYQVTNIGPTRGCAEDFLVVLRRTQPANLVSKEPTGRSCLDAGASKALEVLVPTPREGDWFASAQWLDDAGLQHTFVNPPAEVEFQVYASAAGTDSVAPWFSLKPYEQLVSNNAQYRLVMQGDGNLVMYTGERSDQIVWASWTDGNPGASFRMGPDGNAVVETPSGLAVWSSNTAGNPGARFVLQPDGNIVVYGTADQVLWSPYTYWNAMLPDQTLLAGQWLSSSNAPLATLRVGGDGNVVLYKNGAAVWSTGTAGNPGAYLAMQGDGNLVVYSSTRVALWNSGTFSVHSYVRLEGDGNFVMYNTAGAAIWSTNTGVPPAPSGYSLPWPAGGPRSLGSFGLHSFDGLTSPQSSLDFMGSGAVTAIEAGTVITFGCSGLVAINHGGGLYSSYYHLSGVAVSNGQQVSKGQVLGQAGTVTGCGGTASGNHVHFTMYSTPGTLNPFNDAQETSLVGRSFGGWVVQSNGCMRRSSDGLTRCANQQIAG